MFNSCSVKSTGGTDEDDEAEELLDATSDDVGLCDDCWSPSSPSPSSPSSDAAPAKRQHDMRQSSLLLVYPPAAAAISVPRLPRSPAAILPSADVNELVSDAPAAPNPVAPSSAACTAALATGAATAPFSVSLVMR